MGKAFRAIIISAGEITMDDGLAVIEITNLSTGFCPEPEYWTKVSTALNRIGLAHQG